MALALKGLLHRKSPHTIVKRSLLCFPIDAVVYLKYFVSKKKVTLYSIILNSLSLSLFFGG